MVENKIGAHRQLNIAWILLGDKNVGSSRIHGLNIHNYLLGQKVNSKILQSNYGMVPRLTLSVEEKGALLSSGLDVLIFQKVFDNKAIELAYAAREQCMRTIFLISDKYDTDMITAVDRLVVSSDYLRQYYSDVYAVEATVIEDAIESDIDLFKSHSGKDPQAVWVGHEDNWKTLSIIWEALNEMHDSRYSLRTISNHPDATVAWDLNTVTDEILTCDIAVIPTFHDDWALAKSNNRLTMFMALGIPVIASNIPAYNKIIKNGVNGFLADNKEDWIKYLSLLQDPELRIKIAAQARRDVIPNYSIDVIGKKWLTLFAQMINA